MSKELREIHRHQTVCEPLRMGDTHPAAGAPGGLHELQR